MDDRRSSTRLVRDTRLALIATKATAERSTLRLRRHAVAAGRLGAAEASCALRRHLRWPGAWRGVHALRRHVLRLPATGLRRLRGELADGRWRCGLLAIIKDMMWLAYLEATLGLAGRIAGRMPVVSAGMRFAALGRANIHQTAQSAACPCPNCTSAAGR